MESKPQLVWTDYMRYRAALRGFDLVAIEDIVRYSPERYFDTATGRPIVVGHVQDVLVIVPYELIQGQLTPVTIHATTRQQVNFRLKTGRFISG
jgi:hypothetical protein